MTHFGSLLLSRSLTTSHHCSVPVRAADPPTEAANQAPSAAAENAGEFKSRIKTWLKDSEEDASQAERYLDKRREKLKQKADERKAEPGMGRQGFKKGRKCLLASSGHTWVSLQTRASWTRLTF